MTDEYDDLLMDTPFEPQDIEVERKLQEVQLKQDQYEYLEPKYWPKQPINWVLNKEFHRFALDNLSQQEFEQYYPEGLIAGKALFSSFDKVVSRFTHRTDDQLWEVGFSDSLAKLLAWVEMGYELTPICIQPDQYFPEHIALAGGNHRYALCKGRREHWIPFLCRPEHKEELSRRLDIEWY